MKGENKLHTQAESERVRVLKSSHTAMVVTVVVSIDFESMKSEWPQ